MANFTIPASLYLGIVIIVVRTVYAHLSHLPLECTEYQNHLRYYKEFNILDSLYTPSCYIVHHHIDTLLIFITIVMIYFSLFY